MDKFEEHVNKLPTLSDAERKKVHDRDRAQCGCPPCPTHLQCAKDRNERLYCFEGKSGCLTEQKVCFCPDCPVHERYGLTNMYYCLKGTEEERRGQAKK